MNNTSIPQAAAGNVSLAAHFHSPKPNVPLMWALGYVNRWLILRDHFRVQKIDLLRRDLHRLYHAVNRGTAAFLAPNHPEFGFDWMLDKEISTYASPRMASWAAHEIIGSAPWFWRRNNLIANNGGEAATTYSIDWALKGHAVLAHPEGMVHWTADKIHPLFPGVADMATIAALESARRGQPRPVYIVPVVWKLQYTDDISGALHREMRLIERSLGLPDGSGRRVADRFTDLQERILARQMVRFGFDASLVTGLDFFNRQNAFRAYLVATLQARYRVQLAESTERTIHRLGREIAARRRENPSDGTVRADADRVREAERLGGFSRDVYGTPVLSQEQVGESLKRHRATLMRTGTLNVLHNYLPQPFGPRIAHVRVPEAIRIDEARASGSADERKAYVAELLHETRARMQATLDSINAEIAAEVLALSYPNPLSAHGAARAA